MPIALHLFGDEEARTKSKAARLRDLSGLLGTDHEWKLAEDALARPDGWQGVPCDENARPSARTIPIRTSTRRTSRSTRT